jgi:hypothetical protein
VPATPEGTDVVDIVIGPAIVIRKFWLTTWAGAPVVATVPASVTVAVKSKVPGVVGTPVIEATPEYAVDTVFSTRPGGRLLTDKV